MTPEERYSEAQAAQAALDRFLGPAFAVVEAEYTEKLTQLAAETPWETDRIRKLAAAIKIARAVRGQVEAIISDGKAAAADMQRAKQLSELSDHKRKILGIG